MKKQLLALALAVGTACSCVTYEDDYAAVDDDFDTTYWEVYEPAEYTVTMRMPEERYERRTAVPRNYRDPVWLGGHWTWRDNNWVWLGGRWVDRPRTGVNWVEPRLLTYGDRTIWRSGYWR